MAETIAIVTNIITKMNQAARRRWPAVGCVMPKVLIKASASASSNRMDPVYGLVYGTAQHAS